MRKATSNKAFEELLQTQLDAAGITGYEREAAFIPGRKFRADFYWPRLKLAVEVDGGLYMSVGGHTGKGREEDMERDYLALRAGVTTLRVSTGQVRNGQAIAWLKDLFARWDS